MLTAPKFQHPLQRGSDSCCLKHHLILLCRLMLQGWNSALQPKITCSGFGSLHAFVLQWRMHLFDCKPSQKKHRSPLTISPILASPSSLDIETELHLREADYLKAKLSHTGPACKSSLAQRLFFSSFPWSAKGQQQDFPTWAAIRAGVGGVPVHVLKMNLWFGFRAISP